VNFVRKLKMGGEVIACSEILDRIDDLSDLTYLEVKLAKGSEDQAKARTALVRKFGKCAYTVHHMPEEDAEVRSLELFFYGLLALQMEKINEKLGVNIGFDEIRGEVQRYVGLEAVIA
jgi:hypothetical protein